MANSVLESSPAIYGKIIRDNESLLLFMKQLSKFDRCFNDMMVAGADFTLRLEVHGDKGEVLHCRCDTDEIERPNGSGKKRK